MSFDKTASLDLPSRYMNYDFKEMHARTLKPREISTLFYSAQNEDMTVLIDVLRHTVDDNFDKLSVPDFYYVMYWQRLNSYKNNSIEFPWKSKYGSDEKYVLTWDNIKIDYLKVAPEVLQTYTDIGIREPTVADLMSIERNRNTIPDNDKWLYSRAQYITEGTTIDEKLNFLDDMGVEFLEKIREFTDLLDYGVKQETKVYATNSKEKKPDEETVNLALNAGMFFTNL